ncbi:MAG: hypothetical protein ACLUIQ_01390 [Dialister invisus]
MIDLEGIKEKLQAVSTAFLKTDATFDDVNIIDQWKSLMQITVPPFNIVDRKNIRMIEDFPGELWKDIYELNLEREKYQRTPVILVMH